ncbi:MAG: D-glycero-alpha-D-manno-heptose 1-phosphate guanylyltransferase [Alphaproteobacteria bacterium MarineAlpha3_Bin5]|nr:alcohol dehydrogenase [Magnetovibrio sp.]PPR76870.1 MAG: D-glycero-alpha-D-manno-heptose 1-phosphate guanylyltransferase [Alphaproteobacteria bacterium MarineAlpha3_Bin5]
MKSKNKLDWRNSIIPLHSTIRDSVLTLNAGGFEIALVVDSDEFLLGTITDGDVRRGLLGGLDMSSPVCDIMNTVPKTANINADKQSVLNLIVSEVLRQIPLTDNMGRVVGITHIRDLSSLSPNPANRVILMAGGLGKRLRPLTENTPKPLLKIGNKPLLQSILEGFIEQGFHNFYIAVNYQAEAILSFFGDGSKWGVNIEYLKENKRLGTAGALTLLPEVPTTPLIVMNGDLVTQIRFQDLLDYHTKENCVATMCVREYDFQVPFGVVNIDNNRIKKIDEKPIHRFFVNAGIYVLEPRLIGSIPRDKQSDMTQVFERAVFEGEETAVFPIHEHWMDIGRLNDLGRAQTEYNNNVNS